MSELQAVSGSESPLAAVHSQNDGRCDGSRTSPDTQYEIMRRHKNGLCTADIARQTGCDPRTVKAVIQNWGTSAHTLRLQAHRSQVVDNILLGMQSAAEKGKLDSLLSLSDRLGITEAPKTQQGNQVAVQINLHGGPEPQSLVVSTQTQGDPTETGLNTVASDKASYVDIGVDATPVVSTTSGDQLT